MRFEVKLVPSADGDLDFYRAHEQKTILNAIAALLEIDADVETRRRKRLCDNPLAPWELRIGPFRAFYEIRENQRVRVLAIGHKEHNMLFIRGKRVQL